jgi:uncharacterized membrane protein YccC
MISQTLRIALPQLGGSRSRRYVPHTTSRFPSLLWARLIATDPGLLRLLLATRGSLSVALTTALVSVLAHVFGLPVPEFAFGIVLSLVGMFVMRDPTRRGRQMTLLCLLPPAALTVCVTALVDASPPAGETFLLTLMFLTTLLQSLHPRALGMGLIAVIMAYIGLYLHLPVRTLPAQLASLLVGAAVVWVVSFILMPLRPASVLRRAVRSVQRRAGRVLRQAGDASSPLSLSANLADLNQAALAAEDQLDLLDEPARLDVRRHLFELEQAVAELVGLVGSGQLAARHRDRVQLAGERLRRSRLRGGWAWSGAAADPPAAALSALARAATGLEEAAARALNRDHAPDAPAARMPWGPLSWRMAAQVTLASVLAMAGGMLLSPQRWFWAVIAVYVVFLNSRSRGDTIHKGSHRVAGTLVGLFGGLAIGAATAGDPIAEAAIMLASVFGIYYFYAVSYSVAIFCVTVLLSLVYGALGNPMEQILMLRLEETAWGVVAAVLAASFVWPTPTRQIVRLSGMSVLRSLQDVVRTSLGTVPVSALAPIEATRRLDRQLFDLRRAMTPLTAGRSIVRRGRADRPVTALLACADAARALAAPKARVGDAGRLALQPVTRAIEAKIEAILAGTWDAALSVVSPPAALPEEARVAAEALHRLDVSLTMLAERLETNLLDGFAID